MRRAFFAAGLGSAFLWSGVSAFDAAECFVSESEWSPLRQASSGLFIPSPWLLDTSQVNAGTYSVELSVFSGTRNPLVNASPEQICPLLATFYASPPGGRVQGGCHAKSWAPPSPMALFLLCSTKANATCLCLLPCFIQSHPAGCLGTRASRSGARKRRSISSGVTPRSRASSSSSSAAFCPSR